MSDVTIQFQGICTNFQPGGASGAVLPPQVADRVVLVNADREITIDGHLIPAHLAWLQLPTGPALRLEGCTLQVANPIQPAPGQTPVIYEASYGSGIPNLTDLMDGTLGPPSPQVVAGNDPALASCYFDFISGTFSACVSNLGAATTTVVVETEGDPVLSLTAFPNSPPPPRTSIPLPSGSILTVIHAAEDESGDDVYHFLLSYLTAASMPMAPALPPAIAGTPCGAAMMVGVSCSNSSYP